MAGYRVGSGNDEIEPGIAPLVDAVQKAGFVTFSSCEGHEETDDPDCPDLTSVAFYAHEDEAKRVHDFLLRYQERLTCWWYLSAGFVAHRETREWVLGWTLQNYGFKQQVDKSQRLKRTVQAGKHTDVPILIEMFAEIASRKTSEASN